MKMVMHIHPESHKNAVDWMQGEEGYRRDLTREWCLILIESLLILAWQLLSGFCARPSSFWSHSHFFSLFCHFSLICNPSSVTTDEGLKQLVYASFFQEWRWSKSMPWPKIMPAIPDSSLSLFLELFSLTREEVFYCSSRAFPSLLVFVSSLTWIVLDLFYLCLWLWEAENERAYYWSGCE